jgi:hypothetical protein
MRKPGGGSIELCGFAFAFAFVFAFVFAFAFAGIRDLLARFKRRPCAGRHLLFFAAAKKSRQKKAANTASTCSYPRAPHVPTLRTEVPWSMLVANALNERPTRFECFCTGQRQRTVCAAQVANCV